MTLPQNRNKLELLALAAGGLFLCNPVVGFYDVLPDLFGYALLWLGLWRLSELSDDLRDAMRLFRNLIWVSVGQLAAQWIIHDFLPGFIKQMEGTLNEVNEYESPMLVLLASFAWAILTWYYLIPAVRRLFAGFGTLALCAEGSQIATLRRGRTACERMARVSVWFAILLPLLALLPELSILTTFDLMSDQPSVTFDWYRFINLFRIVCGIVAGVVGIVWFLLALRFYIKVMRDRPFLERIENKYEAEVLPRVKGALYRRASAAFVLITVGLLFAADIRIDGHPVLHPVLCVILLSGGLFAILRPTRGALLAVCGTGIPLIAVSHAHWVLLNAYLHDHRIEEALYTPRAYDKFFVIRCLEAAQAVLTACFFAVILLLLWRAIREMDRMTDGAVIGRDSRRYLTRLAVALGFSALMAGFGIANAIFQLDVKFLWWLTLGAFVGVLFATRSFMMNAKDELFSCAHEESMNKIEDKSAY